MNDSESIAALAYLQTGTRRGYLSALRSSCDRIYFLKEAHSAIHSLLQAKEESDRRNYSAKHHIMRQLILKSPNDFLIDSERDGIAGITHKNGFRIHLPSTVVPSILRQPLVDPIAKVAANDQNIFVTGFSGAGKSTLSQALGEKLQMPIARIDSDPEFKEFLKKDPDFQRVHDPELTAKWLQVRRDSVARAIASAKQPHIIEGTQILSAPEMTEGHRRVLVDTPEMQIVRQRLNRDRLKAVADPNRDPSRVPGLPGSSVARARAAIARKLIASLRPEYEAFKGLPGVELVPSRKIQSWVSRQPQLNS